MSFYLSTVEGGQTVLMFNEACGSPNLPSQNFSSASQVMFGKTRMSFVYNAFVGF